MELDSGWAHQVEEKRKRRLLGVAVGDTIDLPVSSVVAVSVGDVLCGWLGSDSLCAGVGGQLRLAWKEKEKRKAH